MRVLNPFLTVLFVTAASLTLAGCLSSTNTPAALPPNVDITPANTVFTAYRNVGFEDATITTASSSSAIGTDTTNASFTSTGATSGFTINIPADTSIGILADTATVTAGDYTAVTSGGIFPTGAREAPITTTTLAHPMEVYKFGYSQGLQYTEYGMWLGAPGNLGTATATTVGVFAIGSPTTVMPAAGTATYTGGAAGVASNSVSGGMFSGTAHLTATFAAGGGLITGSITDIKFSAGSGETITGSMNDIELQESLSHNITGNTFSGTTATGSPSGPAGTNLDISGATGTYGGTFNGPAGGTATEVGGTFQLSGGSDAATRVVGSFGAKR